MLWTEQSGAGRTSLKALRIDGSSLACDATQVIDATIGGGAARADLGIDPSSGAALAIWQQFEGGSRDDGSRSNIAINRYDPAIGRWTGAMLAETQPGCALDPHVSVSAGQALLGWIQLERGVYHAKALLHPLANTTAP